MHAGPGQGNDSPMLAVLLGQLTVPRPGKGPARTTPTALLGDKAYSSRATRRELRRRRITAVIPEPSDQVRHRARRGTNGGRPVSCDRELYRGRNVVERAFNVFKQWRGLASRYDKLALIFRGGAILRTILIWLTD